MQSNLSTKNDRQTRLRELLRAWRQARGMSQFALALEAGVSARHLSFVENGRSEPSRDLVVRLGSALALSLRERNALLVAAGYAPVYRETALAADAMAPVRRAMEFILGQQEPFPAFVVDRRWDVLAANRGLKRLFAWMRDGAVPHANIMRQVFDPEDMRPHIANWPEVAAELLRHLRQDAAASPQDVGLRSLLDEVLAYPAVPGEWREAMPDVDASPLMTVVFRKGDTELGFFSTIMTFATPRDVVADELRIECMFPLDPQTDAFCRALAAAEANTERSERASTIRPTTLA